MSPSPLDGVRVDRVLDRLRPDAPRPITFAQHEWCLRQWPVIRRDDARPVDDGAEPDRDDRRWHQRPGR